MGVMFSFLDFFDILYKKNAFKDPVIGLGSLNINESDARINEFAGENTWWKRDQTNSVRSLLRDKYKITNYKDIDINDYADIYIDLNMPLDDVYKNSANVILNGGTLEHIFDIAQAIKNIHNMVRSGGTIIHLSPISWYDHGYYNINPLLFTEIARCNNYQLLAEGFYCNPYPLTQIVNNAPVDYEYHNDEAITYITFDGKYTEENERIKHSLKKSILPSNLLYMVAYQKNSSDKFVYPTDIQYEAIVPRPSKYDDKQIISLTGDFIHENGYAWYLPLEKFAQDADNLGNLYISKLVLLEDGTPLWYRHMIHDDIRKIGLGRYSHWNEGLIFSTSDNSDPNTNGRTYQIVFAEKAN
ncbi:MAG: hypothetical protein JEZ03_10260 [Bacteroidales bacterium]|nr:hypothetical protein [Bacteroidales bacterium]